MNYRVVSNTEQFKVQRLARFLWWSWWRTEGETVITRSSDHDEHKWVEMVFNTHEEAFTFMRLLQDADRERNKKEVWYPVLDVRGVPGVESKFFRNG